MCAAFHQPLSGFVHFYSCIFVPMGGAEHCGYEQYLEKQVVVLLRNNRYIYGTLKSYDQYHSVALNYATERIFHENRYSERMHGLIVLRGENISLVGLGTALDTSGLMKADFDDLSRELDESKASAE